jgi:hypothetical protein
MTMGLSLNVVYDSSVNSAPAQFKAVVAAVVQYFESTFTNPVTITIDVGYGEVAGQSLVAGALGESNTNAQSYTYSQVKTALVNQATSTIAKQAVSTLPTSDPLPVSPPGQSDFLVATAEAKALGLQSNGTQVDGAIGISSSASFSYNENSPTAGAYDLFGVVAHEISEVMGRFSEVSSTLGSTLAPLDLFRYSAAGTHQYTTGSAYFSTDNGVTNQGNFNTNSTGDSGDWASSVGPDSFLAFSSSGVANTVTSRDVNLLNALGYNVATATTPAPTPAPTPTPAPVSSTPTTPAPSTPSSYNPYNPYATPTAPSTPSSYNPYNPSATPPAPSTPSSYNPYNPYATPAVPSTPGSYNPYNPYATPTAPSTPSSYNPYNPYATPTAPSTPGSYNPYNPYATPTAPSTPSSYNPYNPYAAPAASSTPSSYNPYNPFAAPAAPSTPSSYNPYNPFAAPTASMTAVPSSGVANFVSAIASLSGSGGVGAYVPPQATSANLGQVTAHPLA